MNKVRFKTRKFESIYAILFGTFVFSLFLILAFKVYEKDLVGFWIMIIISVSLFVLMFIYGLVCYQYCEYEDGVFTLKCPLYIVKRVRKEDIVKYEHTLVYLRTRNSLFRYPVIRAYTSLNGKVKHSLYIDKKLTYFHIYNIKDNYQMFEKIMES